ncbi:sigma factor-like helix-turn-helix DNA-binding protein [Nonomuraea salmonea]|uniref:Sigma factor-like helix-turn-helix DNA-binding protein n=1 Tax=Nonomuraea salmonea TaxID=46181 RepID=A0ABV5NWQ5_9ACTN
MENDMLSEMYEVYAPRLLRAALLRGANAFDAHDAVHETFLLFLHQVRRGGLPEHPYGWMVKVLSRTIFARGRAREHMMAPGDLLPFTEFAEGADTAALRDLDRKNIIVLLQRLPSHIRAVAALYADGYSPQAISEQLDMPSRAVHEALLQARDRLRTELLSSHHRNPAPPTTTPAADNVGDRAVAQLPPRQREVLQWSRAGYKPAQIAKILKIDPNTARVNLHYARKRMREALAAQSSLQDAAVRKRP